MTHPDEGTLQAFLDDELSTAERGELAEHLLVCDACRATHQELLHAHALFSRAISLIDVESGPTEGRIAAHATTGASAFVRAAMLVLALAATAAAAVPGSPVREWIVETVGGGAETEESAAEPTPALAMPVAEAPAPSPAGVRIPVTESVTVSLSELNGTVIRLVSPTGDRVDVSMAGPERDPIFRTGPGRITVSDGVGGELLVIFPVEGVARLEVDGRLYAEAEDGAIRAHVAGDTVGSSLIWR